MRARGCGHVARPDLLAVPAPDAPLAESYGATPNAFMPIRVGDAPTAYLGFIAVLYSLDLFIPFLDLNTEIFWRADQNIVASLDISRLDDEGHH